MRKTVALMRVAMTLMENPRGKHWGYDTSKKAGVKPHVMYGILARMLDDGWVTDGWEESAAGKKRPPRRYYEITDRGFNELGALVADAERDPRLAEVLAKARSHPTRPGAIGLNPGMAQ